MEGGWTSDLDQLRNKADKTAREILLARCRGWVNGVDQIARPSPDSMEGKILTAILCTYYAGNEDHIPWHFDEIRAHGDVRLIATISLGAVRPFQFRRRLDADGSCAPELVGTEENPLSYNVPAGSLLIMAGNVQDHWMH